MGAQASVPFCESSPCLLGCGDQVPKAFLPPQLWSRDQVSSVRTMCRGQLSCACPDPETGRDPSWQGGGRAGTARVRDKVGQSPAPACPPTHLLSARLRPEVDSQVYVSHLAGREGWAKGAHLAGCRGSGGQAPAGCPPRLSPSLLPHLGTFILCSVSWLHARRSAYRGERHAPTPERSGETCQNSQLM